MYTYMKQQQYQLVAVIMESQFQSKLHQIFLIRVFDAGIQWNSIRYINTDVFTVNRTTKLN